MALLKVHGWPVIAAVLVGFALLPMLQQQYTAWSESRAYAQQQVLPVVAMSGRLVQRDESSILIHIAGQKLRTCKFLGLTAYSINSHGVRRDANIERMDGVAMRNDTKEPGTYDLGLWRIWPVSTEAVRALVSVEHDCGGVTVRSVIAEVTL